MLSCKKTKSVIIIIIRALSQWGKDDGDYDSPTSRDETLDFIKIKEAKDAQIKKIKEAKEAQIKKEAKEAHQNKKMREKERRDNVTIFLPHFKVATWSSW